MISAHVDVPKCVRLMQLGAVNVLAKPFAPPEFLRAVQEALDLDARQRGAFNRRHRLLQVLQQLSVEDQDLIERLRHGLTNRQIAAELDVSLRTVQFRLQRVLKAFGADSKHDLLQLLNDAQ